MEDRGEAVEDQLGEEASLQAPLDHSQAQGPFAHVHPLQMTHPSQEKIL